MLVAMVSSCMIVLPCRSPQCSRIQEKNTWLPFCERVQIRETQWLTNPEMMQHHQIFSAELCACDVFCQIWLRIDQIWPVSHFDPLSDYACEQDINDLEAVYNLAYNIIWRSCCWLGYFGLDLWGKSGDTLCFNIILLICANGVWCVLHRCS